ncbi:MAG TPA: RNA polymerase sigma factor [Polyangia bacterium]|nr:RNA polymerase sigma factor [Polyangia bacterium]
MEPEALEAAELMARYCDGDVAAFHQLYAKLAPRVLAYLKGLLGERAAAEDVLQQAFIKVHEARATYVRAANPIPWIYTIAHRTCLDELRRRKRSRVRLTKDGTVATEGASQTAHAAHITGVAEGAHESEEPSAEAVAAMAALQRLPENQRQALILTKVHGRSIAEAAQIAGTTPGAIKLRAHRAYVTLRELLKRKDPAASGKELA